MGVVGVEGLGDAAQVVDVGPGVEGVAHHRPLDGVGAADLALLGGRRAVGVPGVRADADPDRGRHEVTLVAGEPDLDAVGVLGGEGVVHRLEVGQRARGEVVALGGVDVEVVERLEVGAVAERDLDAGLVGLLDVAPPELVHPGEDVGLRARLPVLVDQRDLEVELRLPGGEAALRRLLLPAQLVQLRDDAGAVLGAVEGRYVAEAAHRLVGDAGLDLLGGPSPGDHGWAHPHGEGTLLLEVGDHRCEPRAEVVVGPVDDRALGEVGQVAPDLGQLAVEDEGGADDLGAAEPADGLGPPLGLHAGPAGGLEEAGGRPARDEVAVLLGGDRSQRQGGRHPGQATRDQTRPPYVSGPCTCKDARDDGLVAPTSEHS